MTSYQPVIGLEVHAELLTNSKMFCRCAVVDTVAAEPNSAVCEVCTGMPGTLPVINQRAVEFALKVALALDCQIAERSLFARKNYFYPDLPKGFQISQYELPLAEHGTLTIEGEAGPAKIGIRRVHLEEDTGKLFHHDGYSLVDFNRAGVPLLEIVSEPDLHSVADAAAYATELRNLLRYLGVNSGDMEKGVIRFEANVSVRQLGEDTLGNRVEIKNLNSFRAMRKALDHEVVRQQSVVASGGEVAQETLGWDERTGETVPQRGKEEAEDYRYFPEPDLPPLVVEPAWVEAIRQSLPELPWAKRERFITQYELTPYASAVLTADFNAADYFELVAAAAPSATPPDIANWITGDFFGLLNDRGVTLDAAEFPPEYLAQVIEYVASGRINAATGRQILAESFDRRQAPEAIVAAGGFEQESDPGVLRDLVAQALHDHPEELAAYVGGKRTLSNWFFGQVMAASGGRADPGVVRQLLDQALAEHAAGEPE